MHAASEGEAQEERSMYSLRGKCAGVGQASVRDVRGDQEN
jgi:hypothetical protein